MIDKTTYPICPENNPDHEQVFCRWEEDGQWIEAIYCSCQLELALNQVPEKRETVQ